MALRIVGPDGQPRQGNFLLLNNGICLYQSRGHNALHVISAGGNATIAFEHEGESLVPEAMLPLTQGEPATIELDPGMIVAKASIGNGLDCALFLGDIVLHVSGRNEALPEQSQFQFEIVADEPSGDGESFTGYDVEASFWNQQREDAGEPPDSPDEIED